MNPPTVGVMDFSAESLDEEAFLLVDDFSGDSLGLWRVVDEGHQEAPSAWITTNGRLFQLSNIFGPDVSAVDHRAGSFLYWSEPSALTWSNYALSVSFRNPDDDGVGLLFCYQNPSNYYKLDLDAQRNFRKIFKVAQGLETTIASEPGGYPVGLDCALRLEIINGHFLAELNGQTLFGGPVLDSELFTGTVALYSWGSKGLSFADLVVRPVSQPPHALITSPGPGALFAETNRVLITVEAMDPDGVVALVELLDGTNLLRSFPEPPYTFEWPTPPVGDHSLVARVTDALGTVGWSEPVLIHVVGAHLPSWKLQPRDQAAALGVGVLFEAAAAGLGPLSYQWYHDGQPVAGATNRLFFINSVTQADMGAYWAAARNASGTVMSQAASLSLPATNGPPPEMSPCLQGLAIAGFNELGSPVLSLRTSPGARVTLLSAGPDLSTWLPLCSFTNTSTPFYFNDSSATAPPRRFYRLLPSVRASLGRPRLIAWGQLASATLRSPPGNSLPAIDFSYELGYDGVEMDLMITRDQVPVLSHGEPINGVPVVINEHTFQELQAYTIGTWRGLPVRIPSLEAALRLNANRGPFLADMRIPETNAPQVLAAVQAAGFDEGLLGITAYSISSGLAFKRVLPRARVFFKAYIDPEDFPPSLIDAAAQAGLDGLMLQEPADLSGLPTFVDAVHCRGLALVLFVHYPANTLAELQAMVDAGADYILSVHHEFKDRLRWTPPLPTL
jgi:glycerophosphoryl diester phosphodiesterase